MQDVAGILVRKAASKLTIYFTREELIVFRLGLYSNLGRHHHVAVPAKVDEVAPPAYQADEMNLEPLEGMKQKVLLHQCLDRQGQGDRLLYFRESGGPERRRCDGTFECVFR